MRTPAEIINDLAIRVAQPESQAAAINAAIRFDVTGEHAGSWLLQLNQARSVTPTDLTGKNPMPSCTFRLSGVDFVNLFEGTVTGQQLFFDGRLDVDGDLSLTLKLPALTRLLRPAGSTS